MTIPDVTDPARLAAVRETQLLDTEAEEVFDRLTRLAVRLLGVPAAFISLVDVNRDFYKSACGFGEPLASNRELTGVTFCHYAVQQTTPLVIPDTAGDPKYRDVPTVRTLGVAAYVGIPLVVGGQSIGAFCTIDMKPHAWTKDEVEILTELAASAQREMELRGALAAAQKSAADAEAANRVKGEFLAIMSHELRTPLNAIGGYSDLIEMGVHGPVTPGQLGAIDRIKRSQKHLLGLINGLLAHAQIDAGAVAYDLEDIDVNDIVNECQHLTSMQMEAKRIRFDHRESIRPLAARADREKFGQIVINLLSNAVKFTEPEGTVTVTSSLSDDLVQLAFEDTGQGIPRDQMERIFEPFVQVDTTLTRTREGTGLGLSISRSLARGMGGDLVATSSIGRGSVFLLTLPSATKND